MPDGTGQIIDANTGGKPAVDTSTGNTGGTEGRVNQPEFLFGYDAEEPATERINTGSGDSGGGNTRRTKSGKPDGRSTRWKRDREQTTGTQTTEQVHLSKISLEDAITTTNVFLGGILAEWLHLNAAQQKIIEVDKEENKALADAIIELGRFYSVMFDPKKVAIFNLVVAFGSVYGTRAYALYNLKSISQPQVIDQNQAPSKPVEPTPIRPTPAKPVRNMTPSDFYGDIGGAVL